MKPRDAARYLRRADRYLANAAGMMLENQPEKAGELVWGAYSLLVKAVAARRGVALRKHGTLRAFAHAIGDDLGRERGREVGEAWLSDFGVAEALHNGFYEGGPDPLTVARLKEKYPAWRNRILPA